MRRLAWWLREEAVGVVYLILITEAFYSCNVFIDKLTKYGLCKCSEVD